MRGEQEGTTLTTSAATTSTTSSTATSTATTSTTATSTATIATSPTPTTSRGNQNRATTSERRGTIGTSDEQAGSNARWRQAATSGGGQETASGNASQFEVVDVSADVGVGESGNLTIAIENTGEETLREATVTLGSIGPGIQIGAGGQRATGYVGTWDPGEVEEVSVGVTIPPEVEQRQYAVEATVAYLTENGERRRSASLVTGFSPDPEIEFEIFSRTTSLRVGETGTLTGELANEGPRSIEDAVLVLVGSDNASELIRPVDNRQYLGDIDPREDRDFEFDVEIAPDARPDRRQFTFRVEYQDEENRVQQSGLLFEDWIVRERRDRFELQNVESSLRIDEEGEVTGEVINAMNEQARDAVLLLEGPGGNVSGSLSATETEYALGDLDTDEAANFSFDVDVSAEASSGPRQFTFRVRYVDEDGDTTRSDPLYARVGVGEERDRFLVEPVDTSIQAGSSGPVRLRVTNIGDEPLTDVSGKLFVDDPLTADDDEAFVAVLGPNESATLVYGVSVAGDALAKEYPLSVDFEYTDADGDTQLSKTYRVGLTVNPPEGDGLPLPFAIGGVVALAAVVLAAGVRR